MRKIRMKVLVVMSVICLSASAQTEYSGIAGASPRLVSTWKVNGACGKADSCS